MVLRPRIWVFLLTAVSALALTACASPTAQVTAQASGEEADHMRGMGRHEAEAVTGDAQAATLRYLGQASLRIVTAEGKTIYVDPYAVTDDDYSRPADLILVTHDHVDHCALDRVSKVQGCLTITQDEAVVEGRHQTMGLGFVTITAVQAGFNPLHDVNSCVGYVIALSDGTSVYVTGDTSTTDDMRDGTLAALDIDYAFWCCDGVYNMGPAEAAEAAAMVGAKHNIPYHNSTTDEGERFDREAAEQFAAPDAMVVYPGEDVELSTPHQ